MVSEESKHPFLFKDSQVIDTKNLHQGDLLVNADPLSSAIKAAHNYYATAKDYSHFMVLTQSCDLVLRKSTPKTKYITLAAVRPVEAAITYEVEKTKFNLDFDFPIALFKEALRQQLKYTLDRFVNNTVDDYFFISKYWHEKIHENLCVFLPLSIAIRARSHYEACLECKIAELEDIFAAKVGWATGNMYSRVATTDLIEKFDKDFDERFREQFAKDVLFPEMPWVHQSQVNRLKKVIVEWKKENPNKTLDEAVAKELLDKVPTLESMLVDRVTEVLANNKLLRDDSPETSQEVSSLLRNNNLIKQLLREMRSQAS
ncbi:MAG: hypothetical protein OEW87_13915 [Flavobacteriaceae bacterium]|nr:hypothetical protein [Flavobacteriaceae bacterium]